MDQWINDWFPTAGMLPQTMLWVMLLNRFEERGSVFAHKLAVCIRGDWRCPCHICHPPKDAAQ